MLSCISYLQNGSFFENVELIILSIGSYVRPLKVCFRLEETLEPKSSGMFHSDQGNFKSSYLAEALGMPSELVSKTNIYCALSSTLSNPSLCRVRAMFALQLPFETFSDGGWALQTVVLEHSQNWQRHWNAFILETQKQELSAVDGSLKLLYSKTRQANLGSN